MHTIGAGGGSIAWIDKGGLLHVGPQSAGAEPGPVAYGQGGSEPTLTDANLVLGPTQCRTTSSAAPCRSTLAAAATAFAELGDGLGLSADAAALAVVRTADENMANAIRLIAVERGLDPRDFALIAFGGAGPLHARAVAERLDMRTVLVPPHPGLCSAFGAAIAQARVDRVQTFYARSDQRCRRGAGRARAATLRKRGRRRAAAQRRRGGPGSCERSADMRYAGQNYELEVAASRGRSR